MKKGYSRRSELLEVAIDLFAAKGYAGTSIRDIANMTGHSVSNIYHYFENKEALWLAILERSATGLADRLNEVAQAPGGPVERFTRLLHTHLELSIEYSREAKIFFIDEEHLSDKGLELNEQAQRKVFNLYKQQLQALQEAGIVRGGNLNVLVFNVLGNINWHLRWHDRIKSVSKQQVRQEIVDYIMRGLGSGQAGDAP